MKFSESWLRSFVNPALDTNALSRLLTMAGLEVEDVSPVAPSFDKVVVGHVLEVTRHPNADRLNVCKVDTGSGESLQIVCGAPNVKPGIKVPCALVGAQLPPAEEGGKPFAIKVGKLRDVESYGMLCSARELKLSDENSGLLVLPDDAPVGKSIRDYLDLDDQVFEIKLTPNKADCLSLLGVAREVAAFTGAALCSPEVVAAPLALDEVLPVKVDAPDLCGRFAGRVIRGVNARAATPEWMVQRLQRSGQRSVSALVDISNYVMLELGRPSHVFDLDKIHGNLEVRWARAGESLKLLNGNTVELDAQVGVIADQSQVESLAGIMGGDSTAVSLDTRNIYLEAAFWWPQAIQGRARRFNFSTDVAHRFERGVDYATIVEHLERISGLILEICGGQCGPVDDQRINLPQRLPVRMRVARARKVIGVDIDADVMADIFTRLGLPFEVEEGAFVVTPPSYRFDLEIEEDLIEEIARIYGFENIPAKPPLAAAEMRETDESRRSTHALRHALAARDYQEVVNFAFVDDAWEADLAGNTAPIRLLNPIASQMGVMRSTLFGSLLDKVRYNLNRKAERVRVFEVGRVFQRDVVVADGGLSVAGYAQPTMIGGISYGPIAPEQWGQKSRQVDFFDVKADVEALFAPLRPSFIKAAHPALHPGRSAQILLGDQAIGWIGELHPRWQQKYELPHAAVLFEIELEPLRLTGLPQPQDVPRFPAVVRDIALVVDQSVPAQALRDAMLACRTQDAGRFVQAVSVFDEFRPKEGSSSGLTHGQKSLAFRILLQDPQATLHDDVVDAAIALLLAACEQTCQARLRA